MLFFAMFVLAFTMSTTAFAAESVPADVNHHISYVSEKFFYDADTGEIVFSDTLAENENDESVTLDTLEFSLAAPSSADNLARDASVEIITVNIKLLSSSGGQFKWAFNADSSMILGKANMTLTVQLKASYTTGSGAYSNVGSSVYHEYTSDFDYATDYYWHSTAKTGYYHAAITIDNHTSGEKKVLIVLQGYLISQENLGHLRLQTPENLCRCLVLTGLQVLHRQGHPI